MSVTYSAGLMTAYGAAKDAGYTGTYTQFCQALADLAGIIAQATTLPAGSQATATYNGGTLNLGIPRGEKGDRGETGATGPTGATGQTGATGNGIASVTKTGTSGLVDTYTITFTDGATTTFEITNGEDGEVTQAQLDEVINDTRDLKSALYQNVTLTWTQGKFINSVGSIYDSEVFALSDSVDVSGRTSINVVTDIQGNAVICIFDANNNVIQYVSGTAGVRPYGVALAPSADHMRISCYYANTASVVVSPLYVSDSLNAFIKSDGSDISRFVLSSEVIDGYLLTRSGSEAASSLWEISDYIPVFPADNLKVICYIYGNASTVFYDKDRNVLFGIDGNNASDYGATSADNRYQIVILSDADNIAFVRFSAWKSNLRVTGCGAVYSAPWKNHIEEVLGNNGETYADKKVLVIGDSISSDAYGNYKKWVTDLIDEGKFKLSNVTNSSQHATGFVATSSGSYQNFITRMEAITDKSTYDLVIVFGGINDYVQNVPLGESGQDKTVYFKPAVDYFFNYLIENFTQARICVLLPLRTYNIYPNTAGNKQEVYAQYIHDVAKSYCLPVLNLTEESGFCPFNETFKQMWTLIPSGYTDTDGTHPNAEYEKKYLAPMIWKFISGLIA